MVAGRVQWRACRKTSLSVKYKLLDCPAVCLVEVLACSKAEHRTVTHSL
jgi:hypothetical protein